MEYIFPRPDSNLHASLENIVRGGSHTYSSLNSVNSFILERPLKERKVIEKGSDEYKLSLEVIRFLIESEGAHTRKTGGLYLMHEIRVTRNYADLDVSGMFENEDLDLAGIWAAALHDLVEHEISRDKKLGHSLLESYSEEELENLLTQKCNKVFGKFMGRGKVAEILGRSPHLVREINEAKNRVKLLTFPTRRQWWVSVDGNTKLYSDFDPRISIKKGIDGIDNQTDLYPVPLRGDPLEMMIKGENLEVYSVLERLKRLFKSVYWLNANNRCISGGEEKMSETSRKALIRVYGGVREVGKRKPGRFILDPEELERFVPTSSRSFVGLYGSALLELHRIRHTLGETGIREYGLDFHRICGMIQEADIRSVKLGERDTFVDRIFTDLLGYSITRQREYLKELDFIGELPPEKIVENQYLASQLLIKMMHEHLLDPTQHKAIQGFNSITMRKNLPYMNGNSSRKLALS